MPEELYDVIIIGGGPAGLSAAQYSARSKLKTIVLDKSSSAGALAFAHKIENYPGICKPMTGKELLDIFRKQAVGFGAEYIEAQVVGVNLMGNLKEVFTMDKTYSGKTVILATGSMARKPSIKGEAGFLGKGVSYCAICDAPFFKGKKVSVVGDSEEAVKEAGILTRHAETVYLISALNAFKVSEDNPVFKSPNLKVILGHTVKAIEGTDVVQRLKMTDHTHKEATLEVSGVFIYMHGNRPVVDFLGGMLELNENECIATNRLMETSIPGVFAAGDVTCTEVRQVVISASNGCVSALSAEKYITHRRRTKHDWGASSPDH
ncbi:MAG: FAD-dependent oxidoreductase [Nitrospirae bacterium]|nr:FAD-dependent oxidoreductase [Nitrospirota bacterium]